MRGRRQAYFFVAVGIAVLLAFSGCNPSAAPADPGKAVVSVLFEVGGSRVTWSGVSLDQRTVVTAAPWTDKRPTFDWIEVQGDNGSWQAEISKVEENWGIVLLRLPGSPPAVGSASGVNKGDKVSLVGRKEGPAPPAAYRWRSILGPLQEIEGEVSAAGTSLPDIRSGSITSGPFLEVRSAALPRLEGGLLLDSMRRPIAMIRLVQVASSGKAAQTYALPLREVKDWASK